MQAQVQAALREALSSTRLDSYRVGSAETDDELLARYARNVALCEASYPALHCLEVCLRNGMDMAASAAFGGPQWLSGPTSPLLGRERSKVLSTEQEIRAAYRRGNRPVPPVIPHGKLVADLSFGFWTSLFSMGYQSQFYPSVARRFLPFAPKRERAIHRVRTRFHDLRLFRNRVFHHEPIWNGRPQFHHALAVETIGWINPTALDYLRLIDRFPDVAALPDAHFHALVIAQFP